MNKKTLFLLALTLSVLTMGAGCTNTPTSQSSQVDAEIASWQTYSNSKFGYEIQYPKGKTVFSEVDEKNEKLIPAGGESNTINIAENEGRVFSSEPGIVDVVWVNEKLSPGDWFKKNFPEVSKDTAVSKEDILFDGRSAHKVVRADGGNLGGEYLKIIIKIESPDSGLLVITENFKSDFLDKVFSTFRFIDQEAVNSTTSILPKTCVDEPGGTPVITSLSVSSATVGEYFEIKGCNFVGLDGIINVWIENSQGVKGLLPGKEGTAKLANVELSPSVCKEAWVKEGGSGCEPSLFLTPGVYKIYVTYVGNKVGDTYLTKKSNEVSLTIDPTYTLESYENRTLNIAFSYPQDWGNISQEKNGTDHISLSVFQAPTIFLAADNGGKSVPRGAYWGDSAGLIDSQSYIDNLCGTKNKAQKCEIKTNSSGVTYAKIVEETCTEAGCTGDATNYYLYNPNSEFKGIIISTDRLKGKNIEILEEKLENLVDSFHFID